MNAHPILFSAPMIQSLLRGSKTATRRVVKPQPVGAWAAPGKTACPYGQLGDLLWVRETCWIWGKWVRNGHTATGRQKWRFRAIGQQVRFDKPEETAVRGITPGWVKRRSIFMFRWASRLTLRLTDVRVERLQDISNADAKGEGVGMVDCSSKITATHRDEFACLWDSINAKRGYGWDVNPWCWCLSFEVIQANVDNVLEQQS